MQHICEVLHVRHMQHNFRICDFENAVVCRKNMQYVGFGKVCDHIQPASLVNQLLGVGYGKRTCE